MAVFIDGDGANLKSIMIKDISHAAWLLYCGHKIEYAWDDECQRVVFRFGPEAMNDSDRYVEHNAVCYDVRKRDDLHKDLWHETKQIKDEKLNQKRRA